MLSQLILATIIIFLFLLIICMTLIPTATIAAAAASYYHGSSRLHNINLDYILDALLCNALHCTAMYCTALLCRALLCTAPLFDFKNEAITHFLSPFSFTCTSRFIHACGRDPVECDEMDPICPQQSWR